MTDDRETSYAELERLHDDMNKKLVDEVAKFNALREIEQEVVPVSWGPGEPAVGYASRLGELEAPQQAHDRAHELVAEAERTYFAARDLHRSRFPD